MMKHLNRWLAFPALILAVGLLTSAQASETGAKGSDDADKVAVVNDTVISQADFNKEFEPLLKRLALQRQKPEGDELEKLRKEVLENLINRELLFQEARKKGITVDDGAVEEEFAQLKKQFQNEEHFQQTMDQMEITQDSLKAQIRQRLVIQKLIEEHVAKDVAVSDAEAKAFYAANTEKFKQPEQIRASHILVKVDPEATDEDKEEARKKLEAVQTQLEAGGDFAELAKTHSEGPSAPRGGDLGYFGRDRMVKPFEEVAFGLESGQVSDIVETQFGYHLIKETGHKEARTIPYEEIEEKLKAHLKEQKIQEAVAKHLDQLKEKADIERFI